MAGAGNFERNNFCCAGSVYFLPAGAGVAQKQKYGGFLNEKALRFMQAFFCEGADELHPARLVMHELPENF
jgi:hypothetical protein